VGPATLTFGLWLVVAVVVLVAGYQALLCLPILIDPGGAGWPRFVLEINRRFPQKPPP
jgi:hypothetical protein